MARWGNTYPWHVALLIVYCRYVCNKPLGVVMTMLRHFVRAWHVQGELQYKLYRPLPYLCVCILCYTIYSWFEILSLSCYSLFVGYPGNTTCVSRLPFHFILLFPFRFSVCWIEVSQLVSHHTGDLGYIQFLWLLLALYYRYSRWFWWLGFTVIQLYACTQWTKVCVRRLVPPIKGRELFFWIRSISLFSRFIIHHTIENEYFRSLEGLANLRIKVWPWHSSYSPIQVDCLVVVSHAHIYLLKIATQMQPTNHRDEYLDLDWIVE